MAWGPVSICCSNRMLKKVEIQRQTISDWGSGWSAMGLRAVLVPAVRREGPWEIEQGLVASLARPGGNLTGFSILAAELMPKQLELLSKLLPQAGMIALLVNPNNPGTERQTREVQEAAHAKGAQLLILSRRSRNQTG